MTEELFNKPNIFFWVMLVGIILAQGIALGERWPERWRWRLGWVTLFGSTGLRVAWAGWDGTTWAVLGLASLVGRYAGETTVGEFWKRRENPRWTATYFAAFVGVLGWVTSGLLDVRTWLLMMGSLGICGATKVGWEATRDASRARRLRSGGGGDGSAD